MNQKNGFSLIEIVLAASLLGGLGFLAFWGFHGFFGSTTLDRAAQGVFSLLGEARDATLARKNDLAWGVHIEESRLVLFGGDAYAEGSFSNTVYELPQGVRVSLINLAAGGSDIVFAKITGESSTSGFFVLEQQGNPPKTKTITLYASGAFSIE